RRRRRGRRRHGQRPRQRRAELVDDLLDGLELRRRPALLERGVERLGRLLRAVLARRRAALGRVGEALGEALRLLADRRDLLPEADVRAGRAARYLLHRVRREAVDHALRRREVGVGLAVAEPLRLVEGLREVVGGLLEAGRVDLDALLERLGVAARLRL